MQRTHTRHFRTVAQTIVHWRRGLSLSKSQMNDAITRLGTEKIVSVGGKHRRRGYSTLKMVQSLGNKKTVMDGEYVSSFHGNSGNTSDVGV